MNGFTFYKSFYDTIKKIRKRSDRAATALSVLEFMFEDQDPQGLTETGEIAFESFKHTLITSKSRGLNGETKSNQTKIKTETKSNQNKVKEETNEIKTETRLRSRLRSSSYSPLFIPPQGEKQTDFEAVFFEKYPKYEKSKGKTEGIDFEKLLTEFEKSTYLRSLYTFKQVVEIYPSILKGEYRDKPTAVDDINAKVERERWYAQRKEKAIRKAENINAAFMKDETFKSLAKRLKAMIPEMARAELEDKPKYEKLVREELELKRKRLAILERNGMTEEDLDPKWHCKKCSDSGYLSSGKMCDCYGKEKR